MNEKISLLGEKVSSFCKKAGRAAGRPVLLLYYMMTDPRTPRSDKLAIGAALAYLVMPVDLISAKRHPILGRADEIAAIAVVVKKYRHLITDEMRARADSQLDAWFGPGTAVAPDK